MSQKKIDYLADISYVYYWALTQNAVRQDSSSPARRLCQQPLCRVHDAAASVSCVIVVHGSAKAGSACSASTRLSVV
jgi:hypothetical protein